MANTPQMVGYIQIKGIYPITPNTLLNLRPLFGFRAKLGTGGPSIGRVTDPAKNGREGTCDDSKPTGRALLEDRDLMLWPVSDGGLTGAGDAIVAVADFGRVGAFGKGGGGSIALRFGLRGSGGGGLSSKDILEDVLAGDWGWDDEDVAVNGSVAERVLPTV
ncbi:hypothetical protein HK104_003442 [Borealophlyctis nickersoniae]|nr:hypothetical protein HK104_003442 [Borealophlyctis nickersoniae]